MLKFVHRQNCGYLKFFVSMLSEWRRPLRPQLEVRGQHVEKATRHDLTHQLILPQFVGSCITARLMKVEAEKYTKKMRHYPNSKLTRIHASCTKDLTRPSARRLNSHICRAQCAEVQESHWSQSFAAPSAQSSHDSSWTQSFATPNASSRNLSQPSLSNQNGGWWSGVAGVDRSIDQSLDENIDLFSGADNNLL